MINKSEEAVKYWLENHGLTVELFSKPEMHAGKSPDFKVMKCGEMLFYCEVKNPQEDKWLDNMLDDAPKGEIVGGLRCDPIFNRLEKHFKKAVAQFKSVNENHCYPNVLIFVNEDHLSDFRDFREKLTGYFTSEDGTKSKTMRALHEGPIGTDVDFIDLVMWFQEGALQMRLFNDPNKMHYDVLREIFPATSPFVEL